MENGFGDLYGFPSADTDDADTTFANRCRDRTDRIQIGHEHILP
jgi:hypothetical protein